MVRFGLVMTLVSFGLDLRIFGSPEFSMLLQPQASGRA